MATWVAFCIGLFSIVSGISLARKNMRITRWPTAPGRVVAREAGRSDIAAAVGPAAVRFEPKVTYQYEVNGTRFEGHGIRPSNRFMSQEQAVAKAKSIPDSVIVHYNPANPQEAYLYLDSWLLPIAVIAIGLVTTLGAMLSLVAR
jgi:hypothetical protein